VIAGGRHRVPYFRSRFLTTTTDNWLHVTTHSVPITHYDPLLTNFTQKTDGLFCSDCPSFRPYEMCNETLTAPLPRNVSSAPLPCSLNESSGVTNVVRPEYAYQTLGKGISQANSSFNLVNFTSLDHAESKKNSTLVQIVTTLQGGTFHALFFNPKSAENYDGTDVGAGPDFGLDYVADTTSMATQCRMATRDCNITSITSESIKLDQNNLSIPFRCYDDFSGNLGLTPATGHERAQGWNMSFYDIIDGSPRNMPVQAQSNPFKFYVAAAVNSINAQNLQDAAILGHTPDNESLVNVGGSFSAFALNCEATIYDVRYSLINGSFDSFAATKASPPKASIIKAPLQVGFGQYHLYEAALIAALPHDKPIADTMSKAFSQTGMALASGAFDPDDAALARFRWTVTVTEVHKAPFWFPVIVCLVYSMFGLAMTIMAFLLRRTPEVRGHQARLMVQWGPEIQSGSGPKQKEDKERKEKQWSGSSERDSLSLNDAFT